MRISKGIFVQITLAISLFLLIFILFNNLYVNLINKQIGFTFNWLLRPAGFALSESSLNYSPSNSYAWALFVGWINSLKIILSSLIFSTLLGIIVGLFSKSKNKLLRKFSSIYVGLIRQIPLLVQLMFWYFVVFLGFNNSNNDHYSHFFSVSNKGINILNLNLTTEFSALLFGLSVFTGAYIAEVIRGGINSVPSGQWEAFKSVGLSEIQGVFYIIIPQSLPAIIPGLTSQYLNLAKNSTLAIAVGYADIYAISDTVINQTGRAIEGFLILLLSFLFLNLIITYAMEFLNRFVIANQNRRIR